MKQPHDQLVRLTSLILHETMTGLTFSSTTAAPYHMNDNVQAN